MSEQETRSPRHGRAEHVLVVSVVLAVPALKLAWTLGSSAAVRDVLNATGLANWYDIVTGMLLYEPLLATTLAVVTSYGIYVHFSRRGGGAARQDTSPATIVASAAIVPAALAVAIGGFYGLWWGVGCGALGYLLRLGVVGEYTTGRRHPVTGKRSGTPAETLAQHASDAATTIAIGLTLIVLPVLALTAAVDGRSWSAVVRCDVDTGTGPHRARMIELERQGPGIVGWAIDQDEVANGINCAADHNNVIRAPLWRS